MMMIARSIVRLAMVAMVAMSVACMSKPPHPVSVAVVVDGERDAIGELDRNAVEGLDLLAIELARPLAPPTDAASPIVARARTAYAHGDFETCRTELGKLDLEHALAIGDRGLASRMLTFAAACAWGALAKAEAQTAAHKLASLGLELPEAAVSPDAEDMIGRTIAAIANQPRRPLAITGEVGGRLTVDGRPAGCAIPCTVDLPPGDHVIAVDSDGFAPTARTIRVPDVTTIALAQQPASRELAAQQWRARVGRGLPPTDSIGGRLLAKLASEPRVAFVHGGDRLTGALVIDGELRASATRPRGETASLVRDLAYDGRVLVRPALVRRPVFWIVVSGAALVVAAGIVALTYQPAIHTSVGF